MYHVPYLVYLEHTPLALGRPLEIDDFKKVYFNNTTIHDGVFKYNKCTDFNRIDKQDFLKFCHDLSA